MKRRRDHAGRWRLKGERGQSSFEFMLVLPFVFVFFILVVEGTLMLETWIALQHAVSEAARYAAVGHAASDVESCAAGRANAGGVALDAGQVTVDGAVGQPGAAQGSPVSVSVSGYSYDVSLGGPFTTTVPLPTMTAVMRLEPQDSSSPITANAAPDCT